jgi:hypothetical protein
MVEVDGDIRVTADVAEALQRPVTERHE